MITARQVTGTSGMRMFGEFDVSGGIQVDKTAAESKPANRPFKSYWTSSRLVNLLSNDSYEHLARILMDELKYPPKQGCAYGKNRGAKRFIKVNDKVFSMFKGKWRQEK